MYPYVSHDDAMQDALDLSRTMTMKCRAAELPFGGGKGVIIGNPATDKREALFQAYGRFVADHSGKFVTGCDVGTNYDDLRIVQQEAPNWVSGLEPTPQGEDSAWLTAVGVMRAMQAALNFRNGSPSLVDKTIAVQGYGKVGSALSEMLTAANAVVYVSDTNPAAIAQARANGRKHGKCHHHQAHPLRHLRALCHGRCRRHEVRRPQSGENHLRQRKQPSGRQLGNRAGSTGGEGHHLHTDFVANAGGVIHATRGAVPHPDGMTIHNEVELIGPTLRQVNSGRRRRRTLHRRAGDGRHSQPTHAVNHAAGNPHLRKLTARITATQPPLREQDRQERTDVKNHKSILHRNRRRHNCRRDQVQDEFQQASQSKQHAPPR